MDILNVPVSHAASDCDACQVLVDSRITSCESIGKALDSAASLPTLYKAHRDTRCPKVSSVARAIFSVGGLSIYHNYDTDNSCSDAFQLGCIHATSQRIGKDHIDTQHTRISSFVSALLGLGLYVVNVALKVVRIVIHTFQLIYYGARAAYYTIRNHDQNKKNYHQIAFCYTSGLLIKEVADLALLEHIRAAYITVKHTLGFLLTPTIADYRESGFFNRLFTIVPTTTPPATPRNSNDSSDETPTSNIPTGRQLRSNYLPTR